MANRDGQGEGSVLRLGDAAKGFCEGVSGSRLGQRLSLRPVVGASLIERAGAQPWSTGNVGMLGVSYLAISQYKPAPRARCTLRWGPTMPARLRIPVIPRTN